MSENVPAPVEKSVSTDPEADQKRRDEFLANMRRVADSFAASSKTMEKFAELPEKLTVVVKQAIDAGSQYVSKIITIGFASFFAIWAMTRTYMSSGQVLLTALLMLVSVVLFVANEIYNVTMINRVVRVHGDLREPPETGSKITSVGQMDALNEQMKAKLADVQSGLENINTAMTRFQGLQRWALRVALLFAIGAVVVMVYSLIRDLWIAYFGR
jgi:uncharacterized membrane protein